MCADEVGEHFVCEPQVARSQPDECSRCIRFRGISDSISVYFKALNEVLIDDFLISTFEKHQNRIHHECSAGLDRGCWVIRRSIQKLLRESCFAMKGSAPSNIKESQRSSNIK